MNTTDKIEILERLLEIQLMDGNWNFNEYMFGMTNGMILSLAILKDEEPRYMDAPDEWLCDQPKDTKPFHLGVDPAGPGGDFTVGPSVVGAGTDPRTFGGAGG